MGKYSQAVKEIVKKLTPQERKQAIDLAEDWNKNSLPKDVQVK